MYKFSRRQFLKITGITGALSMIPTPLLASTRTPLNIPTLIDLHRGKPAYFNMDTVQSILSDNNYVELWGINGSYLGPTFKIRRGDFAKITYKNNLQQNVAINIQGLQVDSELLGGIAKILKPNESWSPIVPINQAAATCWYHSCSLANSAYQTYRGILGMYIIEDDESRRSSLPKQYGVDDIPLILQDLELNSDGVQLYQQNQPHFYGNRLFVNGTENAYIQVKKQLIRLRIVNASLSRIYDLHFDDDREFDVIAKDQGFLPQSIKTRRFKLSPSERIEILVNMSEGGNATLITGEKRHLLHNITQVFNDNETLIDNSILEIRSEGLTSAFENKQTFQFNTDAVTTHEHKGMKQRQFHIDTKTGLINEKRFDPRRIDVRASIGDTEKWTITSSSVTGFKLQGAKFIIESINDQFIKDSEKSWKDTVLVDKKVTILVKFENRSSNNFPFTFGSNDLMLADKGCSGLLVVQ